MRFPWANVLLLTFVVAELVTGFLGLVSGSADEAIFIVIHRVAGYGIVVILLWKTAIIVYSLRRRKFSKPSAISLGLLGILLATLTIGFAWSVASPFNFWLFSGMSWHMYVGAQLVPILAWHALRYTRGIRIGYWVDRRTALRFGALAIAGVGLWQVGELAARLGRLSGAGRRFTGSFQAPVNRAGVFPVVSWFNDRPPSIDVADWELDVVGSVERPLALRYDDLDSATQVSATIDCTGGWYSEQTWTGIPVETFLTTAGLKDEARSVSFVSATGYYRRFSLDEAQRYLLATHVGGGPLSQGHGYPMRLVAPGKRGFEWVKWVSWIEVNETPKWLQPPLPLQ